MGREDADTLGDCVETEVELTEERKETFFLSWTADDLFLDVVGDDKIEVEEKVTEAVLRNFSLYMFNTKCWEISIVLHLSLFPCGSKGF